MNAEHCGRAGANTSSLIVCDHVYTCRSVASFPGTPPCARKGGSLGMRLVDRCLASFLSFLSSIMIVHVMDMPHAVLVYIGILLLYLFNHVHVVFNEIA